MSKTWLITGSSRGLGRSLTEAVLKRGDRAVASARKPEALADLKARFGDHLLLVAQDVTKPEDATAAVAAALEAFGTLDVVVNNAGYGFIGAFEEMTDAEFAGQVDTNFWGVVHTCRAAVPVLRKQGFGHILQITSIGGRLASPGLSGYQAAKFAVEGFSEALAQELQPLGVKLTIVEPGGFRTDWGTASMAFATPMDAYKPSVGVFKEMVSAYAPNAAGDPAKAAQVMLKLADMDEPPLRLPLGTDAMAFLSRSYSKSLEDLHEWADLTNSTDFGDGAAMSHEAILEAMGAKGS